MDVYRKAIASLIASAISVINLFVDTGISPEAQWIGAAAGVVGTVLVWAIPNAEKK